MIIKKRLKAPWLKHYGFRKKSLRYPNCSMYALLAKQAKRFPNVDAYEFFGKEVSFKRFIAKIDRAAQALTYFGVERGDVVTIISANIPEAIIAIYATNKLGAVANIVHPLSSEADIKYALTLTNSKFVFVIDVAYATLAGALNDTKTCVQHIVIISAQDSLNKLKKLGYKITQGRKVGKIPNRHCQYSYREFIIKSKGVADVKTANTRGKDPAVILYSGGTTGEPKGILVSNQAFNAHAFQAKDFAPQVKVGNSILAILPIFHGFGLSIGMHAMWCAGVTTILVPKFEMKKFHRLLSRYEPNLILGVPTLFEAMLDDKKIGRADLSFIEMAVSGGDVLAPKLKDACDKFLRERGSKAVIIQGYGLTEYLAGAVMGPPERLKEGAIGYPIADTFVKIVEPDTDIEKPTGEVGEIVISGPNMMLGYIDAPKETNRVMFKHDDGHVWLHSGDLGRMDDEGYLYFEQRLKRLIVSSGYNIYPNHIESVISEVDGVMLVIVVGVPDHYRGQVAKAYVVPKDGIKGNNNLRRKIMEHCKKNLPKYSLPWQVIFRESLPKTKLGKVAYRKLER
jgi:long-chain acyl-CoA synthetase